MISEDFVDEAKANTGKIPDLVLKKSICSWGSDVRTMHIIGSVYKSLFKFLVMTIQGVRFLNLIINLDYLKRYNKEKLKFWKLVFILLIYLLK